MNLSARVKLFNKEDSNLKAFATLVIEKCFVITDIKIIEGKNGFFWSMPSKKIGEEYKDICYPITADFRNEITQCILEEFEKEVAKKNNTSNNNDSENDNKLPF